MNITQAKKIMGKNFIGPDELNGIAEKMDVAPLASQSGMPRIKFSEKELKKFAKDYILILGRPVSADGNKLTLDYLRESFGVNPVEKEPCFYNQDWYLKEKFAVETNLKFKWYLIRKKVEEKTRGEDPTMMKSAAFPPAILTAFTFFAYYFLNEEILWQNDFIWCSDMDHNGDRIYTGRYMDPNKINKNGFNIHRHLSISHYFGAINIIN
jgi:hypothetical protein